MRLGFLVFVSVGWLAACGSSESSGGSGATGGAGGAAGTAAGGGGSGGTGGGTLTPDPNQIQCGLEVCTTPAEVCCYESVTPGGSDHCAPAGNCLAPNRVCDEAADCPSGQVCCTGAAVLPANATVGGFTGTTCLDANAPGSCVPMPGVGNSSVMACKDNAECGELSCITEDCWGYPLSTCGGSVDCK
jgi:hypothetical protein